LNAIKSCNRFQRLKTALTENAKAAGFARLSAATCKRKACRISIIAVKAFLNLFTSFLFQKLLLLPSGYAYNSDLAENHLPFYEFNSLLNAEKTLFLLPASSYG